ncbi:Ferritin [Novipirellula aureliae]|uniref:Ferritin n=1 Tax=Novipirellula aureliae TaxID=2527966 RepID=A0A5C6DSW5_9BACT|nr:ferritin [Novipirellula aureliae]TWU37839.1 Ferritin [Novipirellula aureliae]
MNKEIEAAFNDHLNAELHSSYLYLSMSNYFAAQSLSGMENWMRLQADEERAHGMKFIDFINERNGRVILQQIDTPKVEWKNALEAFQDSYDHECLISSKIDKLVDLATKHSDHAATAFLQWFVNEQVEEEAAAQAIVDKLRMIGDQPMGLFMIDAQLAGRKPEEDSNE